MPVRCVSFYTRKQQFFKWRGLFDRGEEDNTRRRTNVVFLYISRTLVFDVYLGNKLIVSFYISGGKVWKGDINQEIYNPALIHLPGGACNQNKIMAYYPMIFVMETCNYGRIWATSRVHDNDSLKSFPSKTLQCPISRSSLPYVQWVSQCGH